VSHITGEKIPEWEQILSAGAVCSTLVNGLDDIGLTLRHADKIKAFEAERLLRMPWLATQLP